jgi:dCMP deaminase
VPNRNVWAKGLKQVVIYVPVIHAGYEGFLQRHSDADEILLLGDGFRALFRSLAKDIRALPAHRAAQYLSLTVRRPHIRVIQPEDLPGAVLTGAVLVMPDEDIMHSLASLHGFHLNRQLVFDKTFLRWDREWSQARQPVDFDGTITSDQLPRKFIAEAQRLSRGSSDWWRQVGAVAVRDEEIIAGAWNRHYPTEYSPYIDGDPRDAFARGVRPDLSTALHAEAELIAQAARDGLRLAGADLYCTTFPCPACARLIVSTHFKRCFFAGPYSILAGEQTLRAAEIEVIFVDTQNLSSMSAKIDES